MDVYLPDSCLQGEELPAHVLWDKTRTLEIRVHYPDSLELKSVYNVPGDAIITERENEIRAIRFEQNGYLGIVFQAKMLDDPRRREEVTFDVGSSALDEWEHVRKTVDLFRPSLEVRQVPEQIRVDFDPSKRSYKVSRKLQLTNTGDGTAVILVDLGSDGDFQISEPQGTEDFQKAFLSDAEPRLRLLASDWKPYSSFVDEFITILRAPMSLDKMSLDRIASVFRRLENIARESEPFLEAFINTLVVSYLRNLQIITEVTSFMDYLNSIGEGRVVLLNSVRVIRPKKSTGSLRIRIQMTDLAYNNYPEIEIGPVQVVCPSKCEIPVHLLFDWTRETGGK